MSKSRIIIQKVIVVVALFYITIGIIDKNYFTLCIAVIIFIFELLIMNWNDKSKSKEEDKINKK